MPNGMDKAVIWDMDGVIADTARYHFEAWHEVFLLAAQRLLKSNKEDGV